LAVDRAAPAEHAGVTESVDRADAVGPAFRARNLTRGVDLAVRVRPADSFGARFMGLMGKPPLPPGHGLWLTRTSNIHMFFMRFPIDAIFLGRPAADGSRHVVAVHANLRPWTGVVWYARGADGCLELPAGAAGASGTVVGDMVTIEREPTPGEGAVAAA
jgi:uncharacterized membrane protein (UPF0127 family)